MWQTAENLYSESTRMKFLWPSHVLFIRFTISKISLLSADDIIQGGARCSRNLENEQHSSTSLYRTTSAVKDKTVHQQKNIGSYRPQRSELDQQQCFYVETQVLRLLQSRLVHTCVDQEGQRASLLS